MKYSVLLALALFASVALGAQSHSNLQKLVDTEDDTPVDDDNTLAALEE